MGFLAPLQLVLFGAQFVTGVTMAVVNGWQFLNLSNQMKTVKNMNVNTNEAVTNNQANSQSVNTEAK